FVTSATGADGLFHNDGVRGFTRTVDTIRGTGPAAMGDDDNDGAIDIFVAGSGLWHNNGSGQFTHDTRSPALARARQAAGGTAVHVLRNDGGNAHLAMRVRLTTLGLGSGKNNSFGIGARLDVRAGELYQTRVVTEPVMHFGLGSHFKADVLRVQWPNGVPQTIYFPGTDEDVLELQQLKGSCAFVYTWNGKTFEFITDVMWRSALGMPLGIMGGNAAYAPAGASQEYIRISGEALQ